MAALQFQRLRQVVQQARATARTEAKQCGRATYEWVGMPFVRSRGTLLCTISAQGQCEPNVAAECPEWHGTRREIEQLVAKVEASYPDVTEIIVSGGYDISETLDFDDYEPRVAEWDVLVWRRGDGYAVPVAEVS